MNYKGYSAYVEVDDETGIFHGKVLDTNDVINFLGSSVSEIKKTLKDSALNTSQSWRIEVRKSYRNTTLQSCALLKALRLKLLICY